MTKDAKRLSNHPRVQPAGAFWLSAVIIAKHYINCESGQFPWIASITIAAAIIGSLGTVLASSMVIS